MTTGFSFNEADGGSRGVQDLNALVVINSQGTIESVNTTAENLLGYAATEVIGKNVGILFTNPGRHGAHKEPAQVLSLEGFSMSETPREIICRRKDGTSLTFDLSFHPIKIGGKDKHIGMFRDNTAYLRGKRYLAALNAILRFLAESATREVRPRDILRSLCEKLRWDLGILWQVDATGCTLHCRDIWFIPGTEQVNFGDFRPGLPRKPGQGLAGRVWAKGEPEWTQSTAQDSGHTGPGSSLNSPGWGALGLPIAVKGNVVGVLEFHAHDFLQPEPTLLRLLSVIGNELGKILTQGYAKPGARQTPSPFNRSQFMEALADPAGGIVHELNNALTTILGFSELTLLAIPETSKARSHLQQVMKAAGRSKDLAKQILTLSSQDAKDHVPIHLQRVIKQVLVELRPYLLTAIEIRESYQARTDLILGHPTQLHQVLTDFFTTAGNRLWKTEGVLEVHLDEVVITSHMAKEYPIFQPGLYLRLIVQGFDGALHSAKRTRPSRSRNQTLPLPHDPASIQAIPAGRGGILFEDRAEGKGRTISLYLLQHPQTSSIPLLPHAQTSGRNRVHPVLRHSQGEQGRTRLKSPKKHGG